MLICPQCEFENPEANKFCQNCGTSLTHKTCRECQVDIPIEEEICSFCGASNHTVLWAIISQTKAIEELVTATAAIQESSNKEIDNLANFFAEAPEKVKSSLQINSKPIKTTNRYAIKANSNPESISIVHKDLNSIFIQGKAIDKHPLQKSHLVTLQKQQMDLFAELGQDLNNSYLSVTQYWNLVGVPTHALPYLILEKYTPAIPEIYDAWQQHDQGVVLLPDRSQWRLLTELWSQNELPLLQIIWFLDEMAKLWEPLSRISCAESLLVNNNLRVDEDQSFCLQQLYIDQVDNPPSLKDLARTWQLCFAQSNRNGELQNLNQLLERVTSGEIDNVEQLRLELHDLGLGEDDIESFDIHTNYSEVNTPQSQPNQSSHSPEDFEAHDFFDEHSEEMLYSSDLEDQATAMISMQLGNIVDASCTDIGSQRDHNEDFFGVKTIINKQENNAEKNLSVRGLYIVCDGMGGHAAGEVASAMAVENLQKYFQIHWREELPDQKIIEEGILSANDTLHQTNLDNSRSGSGRMGTTLVMALLQNTQLAIASVGDSRIYRITRKQGLEQLTLDHEVGQREINRGVEPDIAYGRPDAYQLTQALGPRDSNYVRPDIQFIEVTEDSLILLCSDGLSDNNLLEKHWKNYLEPLISSSADLQSGLFKLVEFANHYNGHDNITGILVRIKLKPDC